MDDVLRKLIALAAKRFDKSSELISTDDDMFETLGIHSLQASLQLHLLKLYHHYLEHK